MSNFRIPSLFNFTLFKQSNFADNHRKSNRGVDPLTQTLSSLSKKSPLHERALRQQLSEARSWINASNLSSHDRNKVLAKLDNLRDRATGFNARLKIIGFVGKPGNHPTTLLTGNHPTTLLNQVSKEPIEGIDRPLQYLIYINEKGETKALNLDGSHQKIKLKSKSDQDAILTSSVHSNGTTGTDATEAKVQTLELEFDRFIREKYPELWEALDKKDEVAILKILRDNASRSRIVSNGFGLVPHVHTDLNAYGNPLDFADKFISEIESLFGNTHGSSVVAKVSTTTLNEAVDGILNHFGASKENYDLLSRGAGFTGAFDAYLDYLERHLNEKDILPTRVAFGYSEIEHHSNSISFNKFKDANNENDYHARYTQIELNEKGVISAEAITKFLEKNIGRLRQGSQSAVVLSLSLQSNVTGIKTDPQVIANAVKNFFTNHDDLDPSKLYISLDAAAYAPHATIKLENYKRTDDFLLFDAIAFSPYKVDGGQQGNGIAIVNRRVTGGTPVLGAGGTVRHVSQDTREVGQIKNVQYHIDDSDRYDLHNGGSPNVVGLVRSWLGLKIKELVGDDLLQRTEQKYAKEAYNALNGYQSPDGNTRIRILGPDYNSAGSARGNTLPIIVERRNDDTWIQIDPHIVTHLLQNYFGIATRAGCNCAGPYGHILAAQTGFVADVLNEYVQDHNANKLQNIVRPGWNRSSLSALLRPDEVEYFIKSYKLVVNHFDRFLDGYNYKAGKLTVPQSVPIPTTIQSDARAIAWFKDVAVYDKPLIKLDDRYKAVKRYIEKNSHPQGSNVIKFTVYASNEFDKLLIDKYNQIQGDKVSAKQAINGYWAHKAAVPNWYDGKWSAILNEGQR